MGLELSLQLKLAQKLILTPQLQQAIKLLQLPQLELSQLLNQELIENPVLEETIDEQASTLEERQNEEARIDKSDDAEMPLLKEDNIEQVFNYTSDDYFSDRASDGRDLGYFNSGVDNTPAFEQFISQRNDLVDHLLWQLRFLEIDERLKNVCEFIIGNLSDDGYLQASIDEIALPCEVEQCRVEEALEIVQKFDPSGIAARDLQECLLIQVRELGLEGTLLDLIIREGMNELQRRQYQQLADKCGAPLDDVLAAVQLVGSLEPRPARNFISTETTYIVPDVYLTKEDDGFRIMLNEEGMPRLRMSNFYRKIFNEKKLLTSEEKAFLEEKMRSALWLLKSLDQRNKTIYRVTESILEFQKEYFEKGIAHLRPLTLKEIAQDLGMHESTISRVTSSKYIQTPDGLLSFRYFFSSSLQSSSGNSNVASTSVKEIIRKVIAEEDANKPYSDNKIVELLKSSGVTIARRTVAKYRSELRIPSQNYRKNIKSSP